MHRGIYYIFILVSLLVVEQAQAFPLSETNGAITMTIYSVDWNDDRLTLDIGAINGYIGTIEVVGIDGTVYRQDISYGAIGGPGWGTERYIARFTVPDGTEIDRVDFTPEKPTGGDAFSLSWNGEASVTIGDTTIQVLEVEGTEYQVGYKVMDLKLKVKNTGDNTLDLSKEDFTFIDQYGWVYDRNCIVNDNPLLVVPPNSDKTVLLKFNKILLASKSNQLTYRGKSIDIAGV